MANTEGLTDEVVSSMLSMPSPYDERQLHSRRQPRFPQSALARREQMMESLGEGEIPAARVIRASRAPVVRSSSSLKNGKAINEKSITPTPTVGSVPSTSNIPEATPQKIAEEAEHKTNGTVNESSHRPVIISDSIRERPAGLNGNNIHTTNKTVTPQPKKRESRFRQRQRKDILTKPTVGGFPSLNIAPVGSLTRRGKLTRVQDSSSFLSNQDSKQLSASSKRTPISQKTNNTSDIGTNAESMLANMSIEEIRDGIEEVKSILSAESIEFLRNRKKKQKEKVMQQQLDVRIKERITPAQNKLDSIVTKEMELELEEKKEREEKEKVAELLTKIRTPEDMDDAYEKAMKLGLAPSLPTTSVESTIGDHSTDERNSNLHTATSLLRSTSFRQRLLGARCVCNFLEEDEKTIFERRQQNLFSYSTDDRTPLQKTYPPLLPVALRCILDESLALAHTTGGMSLLSQGLRSIHCLLKLFVHPYHVVNVSSTTMGKSDPFELHALYFMSDISHVPSGTELYPPTQITPIAADGTNGSCYRADSSAASAESDSKAFYNDPAWILLSKMRILPCLSDVIAFLSKEVSSGHVIQVAVIQSICGILAMLAVRSPGAALAIANHKGLLPFLAVHCFSPESDDNGTLFDTQGVLPLLILLCTLARQSKDVASLEVPFDTILPHLQGILCLQTGNQDELQIQCWSIILLRTLLRYGLATEHVQSLIGIAAPHVAVQNPQNTICLSYLSFFASVCNASNVNERQKVGRLPSISEQDDDVVLSMSAVWLSSTIKNCVTSLPTLLLEFNSDDRVSVMKLVSCQLRLLSSFTSAARQSTATTAVPILSEQSSRSVIDAVLSSNILEYCLERSLRWSFCAKWREASDVTAVTSLQEEAIACAFVISFMDLIEHSDVIANKVLDVILCGLRNARTCWEGKETLTTCSHDIHIVRQSWFIEAEFSVLKCLSAVGVKGNDLSLILAFAVSLVGRLNVGHEAIASFVFSQNELFVTGSNQGGESKVFLRSLFLGELDLTNQDRKAQLEHSERLFNGGLVNSLRCTADFSAATSAKDDRFFLPVGATWLWNVLSSTITSDEEAYGDDRGVTNAAMIVLDALSLLEQLETTFPCLLNQGTKLYHLCNVCLYPEEVLRDDNVSACLGSLFNQLYGVDSVGLLVTDFTRECFQHSRLSRMKKSSEDDTSDPSFAPERLFLEDEMRALDDFVGDLCDAYFEYGGQYEIFTRFMRFFLRHDFPDKVVKTVLDRLRPILNVLTIEEEARESLQLSLVQSIKGALPSVDSTSRDSSALLDSFAAVLKTAKKLVRGDYIYMLAISFLSRNLASSFQRCECGLEAMKKRLSGVPAATFYDIVLTSKQLLSDVVGTKEEMVTRVIDRCLDDSADLQMQDDETRHQWSKSDESAWRLAIDVFGGNER